MSRKTNETKEAVQEAERNRLLAVVKAADRSTIEDVILQEASRLMGKRTSQKKAVASAANGKRGGRPKQRTEESKLSTEG